MSDFNAEWARFHGALPPISYLVRDSSQEHWVRFHALPLSKRYAEDDDERSTILQRSNRLAAAVLGEGASCWLVQAMWPQGPFEVNQSDPETARLFDLTWTDPAREIRIYDLPEAGPFTLEDDEEEFKGWQFHAGLVTWQSGAFDEAIARVADDEAARTLWMARETGAVYAPYDGGMDLFLPSAEVVKALKRRFAGWLPANPAGL